jgi:hypothetical protein
MFLAAILRWPFCLAESIRTNRRVTAAVFSLPPVFIVGHWRSGTTFLHNLLSCDPQFCFPTILDALRPFDFYPSPFEFISRKLLLRSLPPTRPMDDLPLGADFPQEDEIAMATMAAPSFFNCFYFPSRMEAIFANEVLFIDPPIGSIDRWTSSLRLYLGKIAALHPNQRLLVKNPAHSARIVKLQAMFPGAKFIHIHRDPIDVVVSTRKLYQRVLPLLALQEWTPSIIDRHVMWSYPLLMDGLFSGIANLPAGDLVEVRYSDLRENPTAVLANIYHQLKLPGFAEAKSAIAAHPSWHSYSNPTGTTDHQSAFGYDTQQIAPYRERLGYNDT